MQERPREGSTLSRQTPHTWRNRLRAAVSYDGRSPVIGQARDFTGAFLDRAAVQGMVVAGLKRGDALLVVSELVTNAVRHATGRCTLALACGLQDGLLEIAVSDTSGRSPQPQPYEPQRIGQHGLEIVTALCVRFGSETTDRGKTVRAHILLV